MDRVLHLHLEHHSNTPKRCGHGVARLRKGVDGSRAVLALAAMVSLALFLGRPPLTLPPWLLAAGSSLLTAKTALFVLSNAIFILLAADCRWFFAAGAPESDDIADACDEPGGVPEKLGRRHHHEEMRQSALQAQSCVSCSGCHGTKSISTASEASTEPAMVASDSTAATLEALEDEEDVPATSRPELLELPDEGESVALELEAVVVDVEEPEPTYETARELDELGIDELNRRFDEFIQSRRNKWVKEETCLQWHQVLTCEQLM